MYWVVKSTCLFSKNERIQVCFIFMLRKWVTTADWRHWLGRGPGLVLALVVSLPSSDTEDITGMSPSSCKFKWWHKERTVFFCLLSTFTYFQLNMYHESLPMVTKNQPTLLKCVYYVYKKILDSQYRFYYLRSYIHTYRILTYLFWICVWGCVYATVQCVVAGVGWDREQLGAIGSLLQYGSLESNSDV